MKTLDLYVAVSEDELEAWLDSHGLEGTQAEVLAEAHGGWSLVRVTASSLVPFLQAYTGLDVDDELIIFNAYERTLG